MDYTTLPTPPRPFQIEGIEWLKSIKKGLLTDDVGLGKTLQAAYAAEPPVLISCPNHLVTQWYEWLSGLDDLSRQRQYDRVMANVIGYGTIETDDYVGTYDTATLLIEANKIVPNVPGVIVKAQGPFMDKLEAIRTEHDWCVINQEMLQTHGLQLLDLGVERNWWNTIIFDESHHLRNHAAKRSRVAVKLAAATPRVYCLTATPIWKEVDDLFNQLQLVDPDDFHSYNEFLDLFCVTVRDRFGVKVLGANQGMVHELDEILKVLRLGRSYKVAGRQLPSLIPNYIKVEMPKELMNHYNEIREWWASQLSSEDTADGMVLFANFSQVLQALRLLARWPGKFEAADDIIEEAIHRPKGRVLVFGWFHDTVQMALDHYNKIKGVNAVGITGSTPVAQRRAIALDPKYNVICATIAALTEGIDLSSCHTVIFLEEHYTPGSMHQALGRAQRERNRESNEDPVLVYYIHSKDTIDEHIHAVSTRRNGTIREVLKQALNL